jgi:hypothetical protein
MATATLTITVDRPTQGELDDIIDNVSEGFGWVEDPENLGFNNAGDTKGQYTEKILIKYMKKAYKNNKQRVAEAAINIDTSDFDAGVTQS